MTDVARGTDLGGNIGLIAVISFGAGGARRLGVEQIVRTELAGGTGGVAVVRLVLTDGTSSGIAALAHAKIARSAFHAAATHCSVSVAPVKEETRRTVAAWVTRWRAGWLRRRRGARLRRRIGWLG